MVRKEYDENVFAQNKYGQYLPAIPEPFYRGGLFKWRHECQCGIVFPSRSAYRGHYALVHILGFDQ